MFVFEKPVDYSNASLTVAASCENKLSVKASIRNCGETSVVGPLPS